ncbi:MAG: winged helix-turn-helix transcriptional regulator [Phycisphaerae bacterium]|nr:winged helix-turn-helix transcriptional regulator [Phycisphaerae bacterium]
MKPSRRERNSAAGVQPIVARRGHQGGADEFAMIFVALGESTRLAIMQLLPRQAVCKDMYNVVELAQELGLTQPTVSHHLKLLREARLVKCRRQCNSLYFYVNQPAVLRWMAETKKRFGCC